MSDEGTVRVVRREGSPLVYLETVDEGDDCTITSRICLGSPGSARFEWLLQEILRGSARQLVRKRT